jgi:hypothetical protein
MVASSSIRCSGQASRAARPAAKIAALQPGWVATTGSENDLNRLGFFNGAAAQSPVDAGAEQVAKSDIATAEHLGARSPATAAKTPVNWSISACTMGPSPAVGRSCAGCRKSAHPFVLGESYMAGRRHCLTEPMGRLRTAPAAQLHGAANEDSPSALQSDQARSGGELAALSASEISCRGTSVTLGRRADIIAS